MNSKVTIQVADPAAPPCRRLLEELDDYLQGLYPPQSNHILTVEELCRPNVVFLTATIENRIIGCGGIVNHRDYAEIKRMYVAPGFRGLRIGRRILDELEAIARSWGLSTLRLESGVSQPEALGLYEKAGYHRRGPFGAYPDDPLCVFMEKLLEVNPGG
jgi:putative acetyltransferase